MVKACIFDLDGVLVDTARYHYQAWKRLAGELGYTLTEAENEQLKGVSRMDSLDIILGLAGVSLDDETKTQLADKKNSWFNEYLDQMKPDEVLPGSVELLQELKSHSVPIALASSSKNAPKVLHLLKLTHYFDAVVDGTMIKASKPDPEVFLLAATRLNKAPHDCIVFEDAEAGVEAAIRAGMKCVGVGSPEQLHKADKVISSLKDFTYPSLQSL